MKELLADIDTVFTVNYKNLMCMLAMSVKLCIDKSIYVNAFTQLSYIKVEEVYCTNVKSLSLVG